MRLATLTLSLCLPLWAAAQGSPPAQAPASQELPEEMVIRGDRSLSQLGRQMREAEKLAYDVFNQFNDDKRFKISCSVQERTGSRFTSQVCQPEFQMRATRTHALAYLESYRAFQDGESPETRTYFEHTPMETVIASQQKEYKAKLRQVAEEHPEFLEALVRYTEIRERYETAAGRRGNDD